MQAITETVETGRQSDETSRNISRKSVGIAFVVWTILGLSFTSEAYLRHYKVGMLGGPMWIYVVEILTSTYIYAVFSPVVFRLGKMFPVELKIPLKAFFGRAFLHLIFSLVFSMICLYLGFFITYQWQGVK